MKIIFPLLNNLRSSIFLALLTLSTAQTALGQTPSSDTLKSFSDFEHFQVQSKDEITNAKAFLLFDPAAAQESKAEVITRNAIVKKNKAGSWTIIAPLGPEDKKRKGKITILALTSSGALIPGEVRWLQQPKMQPSGKIKCLKTYNGKELKRLYTLNEDALILLGQVRLTKNKTLREALEAQLTPAVIEKLQSKEASLGISSSRPLSADTPLNELAARIGQLEAMTKH